MALLGKKNEIQQKSITTGIGISTKVRMHTSKTHEYQHSNLNYI